MRMERSDPEYAEAYEKNRRNMLFGLPVGLVLLVAGLIQQVTWMWIVGAVALALVTFNLLFMGRMSPTRKDE